MKIFIKNTDNTFLFTNNGKEISWVEKSKATLFKTREEAEITLRHPLVFPGEIFEEEEQKEVTVPEKSVPLPRKSRWTPRTGEIEKQIQRCLVRYNLRDVVVSCQLLIDMLCYDIHVKIGYWNGRQRIICDAIDWYGKEEVIYDELAKEFYNKYRQDISKVATCSFRMDW